MRKTLSFLPPHGSLLWRLYVCFSKKLLPSATTSAQRKKRKNEKQARRRELFNTRCSSPTAHCRRCTKHVVLLSNLVTMHRLYSIGMLLLCHQVNVQCPPGHSSDDSEVTGGLCGINYVTIFQQRVPAVDDRRIWEGGSEIFNVGVKPSIRLDFNDPNEWHFCYSRFVLDLSIRGS